MRLRLVRFPIPWVTAEVLGLEASVVGESLVS